MGCYNSSPLKRSFFSETSSKDRDGKDYTYGSQYQAMCPVKVFFSDFDHKTPLNLATKPGDSHFLNDSTS